MRLKLVVKHGGLLFIFVNWEDEKRSRPTATDVALKKREKIWRDLYCGLEEITVFYEGYAAEEDFTRTND